jgi:phytoene dehydrogenase-like protein
MNNNYDIIIIGAGISGLRCATYLYENSLANILVLEAQDRLGGRVNRVEYGNDNYELGAMWIHGIQVSSIKFNLKKCTLKINY